MRKRHHYLVDTLLVAFVLEDDLGWAWGLYDLPDSPYLRCDNLLAVVLVAGLSCRLRSYRPSKVYMTAP